MQSGCMTSWHNQTRACWPLSCCWVPCTWHAAQAAPEHRSRCLTLRLQLNHVHSTRPSCVLSAHPGIPDLRLQPIELLLSTLNVALLRDLLWDNASAHGAVVKGRFCSYVPGHMA